MEHAFGRAAPFALGMEEELLLVDPETLALAHVAERVVPAVVAPAGEVKYDVYRALAESTSPVVRSAPEGGAALADLRRALMAAGATLIGCGIHPDGAFGDVEHVSEERYREVARQLRGLLRRTPTCALHVHVGMPDPETAVLACNRMREHLPLLQALAAHSPYWHGVDSGFATARAQLFRGYPRAIVPRAFADWEDYAEVVTAAVEAADVPDYTFLWWDIRPHPNLGTLEVRAMDAQARLGSVTGLAALVHALAVRCVHEDTHEFEEWEAVMESSFRAGRDGLEAVLFWRGQRRPLREIAARTLAEARPYARDLGREDALEEVERILADGNGAMEMREAHRRGGMPGVLSALAAAARPAG